MTPTSILLLCASLFGFTGLILDAIGAHALKNWLSDATTRDAMIHSWQTAVRYQLIHSVLLVSLAFLDGRLGTNFRLGSAFCLVTGMLFFCGSIYIKTLIGVPWIAKIAPTGGILMMVGWLLIGAGSFFKGSLDP